jgi:hypothetical protein
MDNTEKKEATKKDDKITLTKFIEDNQKLISILGVFTALTVFTANLSVRALGYVLSFIFLSLTLIIWIELLEKFPRGDANWRLKLFEILLSYSFLGIIIYWLLAYPDIWNSFMFMPLGIILASIFISLLTAPIKKYNLFNRFFKTKPGKLKIVRYALFLSIISVVLAISFKISFAIAPPINEMLDTVRDKVINWIPKSSP